MASARWSLLILCIAAASGLATSGCFNECTDCGASETDTGAADVSGDGADAAPGGYPAGPYGTGVDDVIENLAFTTPEGDTLTLGDIRDASDARVLYINTAAGWCTACREEQPLLRDLHDRRTEDGLAMMLTYFEDANFNPANAAGAGAWRDLYELEFTVVADIENVLSNYYDASLAPGNIVIALDSMTIVHISTGENLDEVEAVADALLP